MNEKLKEWLPFWILMYCLTYIGYAVYCHTHNFSTFIDPVKAGQFGDMFGGFNAFFTGLAFIGVVVTLYLQIGQFKETKKETYYAQIENTYFNMLSNLQEIIRSCYFNDEINKKVYLGREYFRYAFNEFEGCYKTNIIEKQKQIYQADKSKGLNTYNCVTVVPISDEYRLQLIIPSYESFYQLNDYNLGHYFRYVFNVIKYIKDKHASDIEAQNRLIGLLQAQLSNDELGLLFYNALSRHGINSSGSYLFREWLDEHNFFQNIDKRCLLHESVVDNYPKTKFKSQA